MVDFPAVFFHDQLDRHHQRPEAQELEDRGRRAPPFRRFVGSSDRACCCCARTCRCCCYCYNYFCWYLCWCFIIVIVITCSRWCRGGWWGQLVERRILPPGQKYEDQTENIHDPSITFDDVTWSMMTLLSTWKRRISRGLPAFLRQFWLHFRKNFNWNLGNVDMVT